MRRPRYLRSRITRVRPMLSVCTSAGPPLGRTPRILEMFRPYADEIVCAVDATIADDELGELIDLADIVVRSEFDTSSGVERKLAWLHSLCTGKWVFRVDSDEVPSVALLSALPDLVRAHDVEQYLVRRRWLWPDPEHFIDDFPWSRDWQIRLVRNEPSHLRFVGGLHSSAELVLPHRYVEFPLYHLDCVLNARDTRLAKARDYERRRPGDVGDRDFPVNGYYLPEDYETRLHLEVPNEDKASIGRAVRALSTARTPARSKVSFVGLDQTDRFWSLRPLPESAYAANLELLEPLPELRSGEWLDVLVNVHNHGSEIWPWGEFSPPIRMACRWFEGDGDRLSLDGPRTPLTADLHPQSSAIQKVAIKVPPQPGRYVLELNMVHESVRWFEGGLRLPVTVFGAPDRFRTEERPSWVETADLYDPEFFGALREGSRRSARAIIPILRQLPIGPIRSALDVGCGVGTWAAELISDGIDVVGVDGHYVEEDALEIPSSNFVPHDLSTELNLGRQFDLVISLEVIEHLQERCEGLFIDNLTRHGDLILFSGAIPGQGGIHHVNERWASHWTQAFRERGYRLFDVIRPAIWLDQSVEWWYRQNILLFARGPAERRLSETKHPSLPVVDVIHPEMFSALNGR